VNPFDPDEHETVEDYHHFMIEHLAEECARLGGERDEARELAKHLQQSVDCWAYLAELAEAYPWLKESDG
jgi:hypothetical protein